VIAATTPHRPDWRYPLEVASWLSGKMTFDLMAFENSRQVNASVLWSIFYEWLFYIFLLPACSLARLTVGSRTWIVPVSFCIAAYIGRLTDIDAFRYLPLFAVGMIAHELRAYTKLTAALRTSWASLAAAASLLVGMICFPNPYDEALPLFAFFFICVVSGNKFFGLLNTKGSAVMGECSFGIYLLHGILLYILFNETSIEIPAVILLPLLSSIVAVTTATTYLLIEVPCIAVGRQMSKKFRPQRGVQSGLPASS
jgi:peptidoglycan/LPS O-acetylase OafA/YrhL